MQHVIVNHGTKIELWSGIQDFLSDRLLEPRIVCQCGGSVRLDFGAWLGRYQRLSLEVEEQIRHLPNRVLTFKFPPKTVHYHFVVYNDLEYSIHTDWQPPARRTVCVTTG